MRCTKQIQKQEENKGAINHFTNRKCDMCQASLGCALVCDFIMKKSHNKLERGETSSKYLWHIIMYDMPN